MDILDKIRSRQAQSVPSRSPQPPEHKPELLYIGCVDARLDPIQDIGIGKGEALIFRNIGALVLKHGMEAQGEPTPNLSVGAVLEFFLHHIPQPSGRIKHIVISGHTDCGGIRACHHGTCGPQDRYLPKYLESLKEVRRKIHDQARAQGWGEAETLHALEEESVRSSMANLATYPAVRSALEAGTLAVHGWVINTATQGISEMHPETLQFKPMVVGAYG